jgi:hypothetical protein
LKSCDLDAHAVASFWGIFEKFFWVLEISLAFEIFFEFLYKNIKKYYLAY